MSPPPNRRWGVVVACLLVVAGAAPAQAQVEGPSPKELARKHHDDGLRAKRLGHFAEAGAHFDMAFELDPHPTLLWNAAQVWERAGDLAGARARYRRFLTLDGVSASLRRDATERLLTVDRAIELRAARQGVVTGGALGEAVRLVPTGLPSEAESGEEAETAGWVLVGAGAGVGVTGVVLLGLALTDFEEIESLKTQDAEDVGPRFDRLDGRFHLEQTMGWALLGVGAALAAAGTTLVVLADDADEPAIDAALGAGPGGGFGRLGVRF